jgi:hypothetical protein
MRYAKLQRTHSENVYTPICRISFHADELCEYAPKNTVN